MENKYWWHRWFFIYYLYNQKNIISEILNYVQILLINNVEKDNPDLDTFSNKFGHDINNSEDAEDIFKEIQEMGKKK